MLVASFCLAASIWMDAFEPNGRHCVELPAPSDHRIHPTCSCVPTEPDYSGPTRCLEQHVEVAGSASRLSFSCSDLSSCRVGSHRVRVSAWGSFGGNMQETRVTYVGQVDACVARSAAAGRSLRFAQSRHPAANDPEADISDLTDQDSLRLTPSFSGEPIAV